MKSFFLVVMFSVATNSAFAACNEQDCSGALDAFDNVRMFDPAKDNLNSLQHCSDTVTLVKGFDQNHPAYEKIKNKVAKLKVREAQTRVIVNENSNACFIGYL